jgi:hypothetical protein
MTDVLDLRELVARTTANEVDSQDSARYWREVLEPSWKGPYPKHWCGAFALWALHKVLGCTWLWCMNPRAPGFLGRLPMTRDPKVGDLCYRAEPYQHHGVIVGGAGDVMQTAEGNTGNPPGVVAVKSGPLSSWTAFYSIEPLIQEALQHDNQT